jgi:hypothetical protein
MDTEHDLTSTVRSWLRTGENESADDVLEDVLALVTLTPQRRSSGLAPRIVDRNDVIRMAITAAAVVVVALVAINLVPSGDRVGGSAPTASPTSSMTPPPNPAPTPPEVDPRSADFRIGRHSLTFDGIPFSFETSTSGWEPQGSFLISKSTHGPQGAEAVIFWTPFPEGVDAGACPRLLGPPDGGSAADLAAAVSRTNGTELVSGPSDVTVGGYAAKRVVVTVREDTGCDPGFFYNWRAKTGGAMWDRTELGDTITVWIVDLNRTLLFIGGETHKDAGAEVEQEIQPIVDSIRFK